MPGYFVWGYNISGDTQYPVTPNEEMRNERKWEESTIIVFHFNKPIIVQQTDDVSGKSAW